MKALKDIGQHYFRHPADGGLIEVVSPEHTLACLKPDDVLTLLTRDKRREFARKVMTEFVCKYLDGYDLSERHTCLGDVFDDLIKEEGL